MMAISSSVTEARKSLVFFEEQQKRTRFTGMELAKFYSELLPLALRKGFSEQTFRVVTVQLTQVATALGATAQEILGDFQNILGGRITGKNKLLNALGIDPESVKSGKVGIREIVAGLEDLARKGEAMGDDFASAGKKLKDTLLNTLSKGFNSVRGDAERGMKGVVDTLTSPEILGAVHSLGRTIALVLPPLARLFTGIVGVVQFSIGNVQAILGNAVVGILTMVRTASTTVERLIDRALRLAHEHPWLARFMGIRAGELRERAGDYHQLSGLLSDAIAGAGSVASGGVDLIAAGMEKLNANAQPFAEAMEKASSASLKLDDKFKSIASNTEKAEKALSAAAQKILYSGFVAIDPNAEARGQATLDLVRNRAIAQQGLASRIFVEKIAADRFIERLNARAEEFARNFTQPVSDMLTGLALDGGRGFGTAAANAFSSLIQQGAENFALRLAGFLGGGEVIEKGGRVFVNRVDIGDAKDPAVQAKADAIQARSRQITAGVGFAQIGIGAYHAGASGQPHPQTSGLVGGALAGFQLAGPIGAIVGGIVGWIGGLFGKKSAEKKLPWAYAGVFDGEATLAGPRNIEAPEVSQMLARLQDTVDTFWNGYLNILMKFPTSILPDKLKAIDNAFGWKATKDFFEKFELWLTDTLPDEIADQFQEGMESAFVSIGMSAERFSEIWKKFDKLDPRKAMELFSILADAVITMDSVLGWNRLTGDEKIRDLSIQDKNPLYQLQQTDAQIARLAANLNNLTGEAQIRTAHELAQLAQQRMNMEKQLLRDLIALGKEAVAQFEAATRGIQLSMLVNEDGTPNISAQLDFLKAHADALLASISTATDPAEVRRLQGEYISTIQQIIGLGEQLGPEYAAAIKQWALDALEIGKAAVLAKVDELGAALQTTNDAYRDSLEPFWNDFMTKVQDAGDGLGDLGDGIGGVVDVLPDMEHGIDRVNRALGRLEERLNNFNPGDGDYGSSVARRRATG